MILYPNIPRPLIDFSPRISDGLSYQLLMSGGRTRQGLKTVEESRDAQLSWVFSQSEYKTFMVWWREELQQGSLPFDVFLLDGSGASSHRVTIKGGQVSAQYSGGLWRVSCSVVLFQVPEPLPLPPPEAFVGDYGMSGSHHSFAYSWKLTKIYYNWSNDDRDSWGKTAEPFTDHLGVDGQGDPVDSGAAAQTGNIHSFAYSVKLTIKRIDRLYESVSVGHHGAVSHGYQAITGTENESEVVPAAIHEITYTYEKES